MKKIASDNIFAFQKLCIKSEIVLNYKQKYFTRKEAVVLLLKLKLFFYEKYLLQREITLLSNHILKKIRYWLAYKIKEQCSVLENNRLPSKKD